MEKLDVEHVKQKRPKEFKKIFINHYTFFIVYLIGGLPMMCFWGYFPSILTTLEKRFNVLVQDISYVLVVGEISTFTFSLLLSYFGGPRHRPRLIAVGILLMGVAGLLMASPHFIFGSKYLGISSDSIANTSYSGNLQTVECVLDTEEPCIKETKTIEDSSILSLFLFALSLVIGNAGYGFFINLGNSFIDDNYKKEHVSVLLGIVGIFKFVGSISGMLIASSMLKFNQNPFEDPGIDYTNPNWIGAWWLGFLLISITSFAFGFLMYLFPRTLKEVEVSEAHLGSSTPMPFKEFPTKLKKLCSNKVLVFSSLSTAFSTQVSYGIALFMPKVIEIIYDKSAIDASYNTSFVNAIACFIGFGVIGLLIQKLKPRPVPLQVCVIVALLVSTGISISITFLGCGSKDVFLDNGSNCKLNCDCESFPYNPICDVSNRITYFSKCHSNCQFFNHSVQSKMFWNCGCSNNSTNDMKVFTFEPGTCKQDCGSNLLVFSIFAIILIATWATVNLVNMLISLRCVANEDKTFGQGFLVSVTTLFGYLPTPIIYSAVVDGSCTIRAETKCGTTGYCMKYDEDLFLKYYFLLAAAGWFLSAISNLLASFKLRKFNDRFYDDN